MKGVERTLLPQTEASTSPPPEASWPARTTESLLSVWDTQGFSRPPCTRSPGSGLSLLGCQGRGRALGRPPGHQGGCHSNHIRPWPGTNGPDQAATVRPRKRASASPPALCAARDPTPGARVLPGNPVWALGGPGFRLKPQAGGQSPILVLSACSRRGRETRSSLDTLRGQGSAGG